MSALTGVPSTERTLPVASAAAVRAQARALLREHRSALLTVVGLHAIAAVAALAAPFVVGRLVDAVTRGEAAGSIDAMVAGLAAAILAQTVLVWAARRESFRLGERILASIRGGVGVTPRVRRGRRRNALWGGRIGSVDVLIPARTQGTESDRI